MEERKYGGKKERRERIIEKRKLREERKDERLEGRKKEL